MIKIDKSALFGLALNKFIDLFYKYEYEHYLNN